MDLEVQEGKKPVFYIDIDDVLIDTLSLWLEKLNYLFDTNVNYTDIEEWDIQKAFPNLTMDQILFPLTTPDFWKEVNSKSLATTAVILLQQKFDVYFVTATHYENVKYKYEYTIKRLFPSIDWDHIIVCQNKSLLSGWGIIDDNPNNLKCDYIIYKYLFSAPYNLNNQDFYRFDNWKDILNYFSFLNFQ